MKVRAVILAGGEGSRLGVMTAKRTKPAVPFAGKYRIIDFTLSNCVNSGIFDVMILVQYRPQSLIEHVGSGVPWDLDRNFTGGVSIHTPYKARYSSEWYTGTADAVQQNYLFIKRNQPDLILILSGDHIYRMNYASLIRYHQEHEADLTMAAIRVPQTEASRFGILGIGDNLSVTSFVEKPANPPSDLANMGVYLFNADVLDRALWHDKGRADSSHDFGKDILPTLVAEGRRVFAYPFEEYWMDVGTIESYWHAHMDLLADPTPIDLNDRKWIIHTRTEERPPVRIAGGSTVIDSMISDGCVIEVGARVERSVLSPGVRIGAGAVVRESVLLTDASIGNEAQIDHAIIDKRAVIGKDCRIGSSGAPGVLKIAMIGKNSEISAGMIVEAGAVIATDVIPSDFKSARVTGGEFIETKRKPYEIS